MHKNATKCNKTLNKWCKNKHGASKIMDTLETYHPTAWVKQDAATPDRPITIFLSFFLNRQIPLHQRDAYNIHLFYLFNKDWEKAIHRYSS
jgi:hypothetical protein